ncbi:MAG: energy transducer TonB [Candidatus Eremiobacteraeota bacterium]|nr:energy transducer TonB [Candidatus Eremiobacteraeota bacterium]
MEAREVRFVRRRKWTVLHKAILISLIFHLVLIPVISLTGKAPNSRFNPDKFQVFFVDAVPAGDEKPSSGDAPRREAPEEKLFDVDLAKTPVITASEPPPLPGEAPPPLISFTQDREPPPGSPPPELTGGSPQGDEGGGSAGGGSGDGTGTGAGTGAMVAPTALAGGCKLFILPPKEAPLPLTNALAFCEGITRSETFSAKSIEMTVSLDQEGQPSNIRLVRSCGNKEIDNAVLELMGLMRFDTAHLASAPQYYLTLVVVNNEISAKGSQ